MRVRSGRVEHQDRQTGPDRELILPFEGELLPLPGDLMKERDEAKAENEELRKEIARLKAARNGAH